ncbi:lipid-A-disaccharide synthase [Arsenophonus endosymbiont of Aleurodicus floccissimus]|uniref:lipid-A-disaccharide synthase n=1 Tax=Arsenophonus endosymbiont of Aleurodicus floccissimus TaxID=2152761 RepID=UPI000E6B4C99|nr:lipid-A-disaccharide synthase [Arsenophonus endosymbiont of Aleurodicus floccissimus]
MQQRPLTIGLVAGETSGDILGASLIRALKQQVPNAHFVGVAGPLMQAEGCEAWYEMEELAVMGIVEVLERLARLLKIRADLTKRFAKLRPDVFVGIDAPDFNITLERKLKQTGVKTIHYVSPSVWAWRQDRVFKIGEATDLVLALLPFEKRFYDRYNIPCRFIGHTMADIIPLRPDKQAARAQLNITQDAKCLAILPGSRRAEVEILSADFLHTAQILVKDFPHLQILVLIVNQQRRQQFEAIYREISPTLPLKILDGQARIAMIAADVTLLASGTASLECMLAKCPMVVGYRMKLVTYWLAKRLVKIPFISLPNLLEGKELVKEYIQQDCQPEQLAGSLKSLLIDEKKVEQLKQTFLQLHKSIRCHADQQAAEAVLELSIK